MRIESKTTSPVAAVSTKEPRAAKSDAAPTSAPSASVVQLSAAATAAAASTGHTESPEMTARLSTIKASLADGSYKVDLDRLASRVVDDESVRGKTA